MLRIDNRLHRSALIKNESHYSVDGGYDVRQRSARNFSASLAMYGSSAAFGSSAMGAELELSATQISLLAEVEAQALWYGSPVDVVAVGTDACESAVAVSYERRLGGFATGIHNGVLLLRPGCDAPEAHLLARQIGSARPFDLLTLRVTGAALTRRDAGLTGISDLHSAAVSQVRDVQEVLSLGSSFPEFMKRLGRSTRRNVEACRRQAAELKVSFEWMESGPEWDRRELAELCQQNMPTPVSMRRISNALKLIGAQPNPYRAQVRDADGRLISVAGGFIHGDLALMLYQVNHQAQRALSPSLMLRSFIIEQLIANAVRKVGFVGSCAGLLLHACERVPAVEILIAHQSPISRLKLFACRAAQPHSRIAQLLKRPQPI